MANFSQNFTSTGLTTLTFVVPLAGIYPLIGTLTAPEISGGALANTQVVTTVTQTPVAGTPTTTVYTGLAGATGFKVVLNCAASDTIVVTFSSSTSVDTATLNVIKAVIAFG